MADFGYKLADETEDKKLDKELVSKGVKNLIGKPKFGQYYIASLKMEDGTTKNIGTTMVTFEM